MTKEQFEVLLKARHIMSEQADKAIEYLKGLEVEESVQKHYELYLSAYNNVNYKVSEKVLKSLIKFLPNITDKKTKGIVYSMMVADAIRSEKYNNAIEVYYEYKKLNIQDDRLDYNFDNCMLNLLAENKIYSRYRKYSQSLAKNPYLYQIEPYIAMTFFYNNAIIYNQIGDIKEIEKNVEEIEKLYNGDKQTQHPEKCQYIYEIMQIFLLCCNAKSPKARLVVADEYKKFLKRHENNLLVSHFDRIDAHIPIIESIIKIKDYSFAVPRIKKMLRGEMNTETRVSLYKLLCEIYRVQKDEKYVKTLETLNKLLLKQEKKYQASVNEGIINSIRFHEVQRSYQEIQQRYETDQLTGCYSRNVLYKKTNEIFSNKRPIALIFFDLDNLKETNDAYNHSYGDQYLRSFVSEIVKLKSESADLFRYGGDEFVLIVHTNDTDEIKDLIESIFNVFKNPVQIYDQAIKINFSAGVSLYPQDGSTLEEIIRHADNAMYQAKKNHLGYLFHKI